VRKGGGKERNRYQKHIMSWQDKTSGSYYGNSFATGLFGNGIFKNDFPVRRRCWSNLYVKTFRRVGAWYPINWRRVGSVIHGNIDVPHRRPPSWQFIRIRYVVNLKCLKCVAEHVNGGDGEGRFRKAGEDWVPSVYGNPSGHDVRCQGHDSGETLPGFHWNKSGIVRKIVTNVPGGKGPIFPPSCRRWSELKNGVEHAFEKQWRKAVEDANQTVSLFWDGRDSPSSWKFCEVAWPVSIGYPALLQHTTDSGVPSSFQVGGVFVP